MGETRAAGYLHSQDFNGTDIAAAQDGCQLIQVRLYIIQFGTGHGYGMPFQEAAVKVGYSYRDAVGSKEQFRVLEIWGVG